MTDILEIDHTLPVRQTHRSGTVRPVVATGQYGDIILDPHTGRVLAQTVRLPREYADHYTADLLELRQWYREELAGPMPMEISVLEVGWWLADGRYLPPSPEYRARLKKNYPGGSSNG